MNECEIRNSEVINKLTIRTNINPKIIRPTLTNTTSQNMEMVITEEKDYGKTSNGSDTKVYLCPELSTKLSIILPSCT